MDSLFWWIGAVMVGGFGIVGAAAGIAGVYLLVGLYCSWKLKRIGVIARNMGDVENWVKSGRPKWRWHGSMAVMEATEPGYGRQTAHEMRLEKELKRRETRRWLRLASLALNLVLIGYVAWRAWA